MKRLIVALSLVLAMSLTPAMYGASIPTPLIDVDFNEGSGTVAANSGSAGGTLTLSTPTPTWSTNVPPGVGGFASVDFGTTHGNFSVESPANYAELTGLTKFTVTGWANCRNSTEGSGGNRLVTWINHGGQGVDVVYKSDGSVQMGINQWPDGSPPRSTGGKITTDAAAGAGNWRFFAVTYDSTLTSGQVKFYFGSGTNAATLDVARDYARGAVGTSISRLCIGHFNIATRAGAQDRMFRGLIDDVKVFDDALALEQIQQVQIGNPETAKAPDPADLAEDVPIDAVLSWEPGTFANTHDVYFGTRFEDVDAASRQSPGSVLVSQGQDASRYVPVDALEFGKTYYWKIDEVNAAPSNTVFQGNVWSFTTEPYAYPLTDVTATASSSAPKQGSPNQTVGGVGLNPEDQHSVEGAEMWLATAMPAWIQYEFDKVYKLHELWVWNANQGVESFIGFGAKTVTIEYSLDGQSWETLSDVPEFAQAPGVATYTANTTVPLGGVQARYVRLTITDNWGTSPQVGLSEVRFFYVPVQAFEPQPAIAATGVGVAPDLNWRPGREATSHKVYLGTDEIAVADGATGAQTVIEHSYTPGTLDLGATYFWKVDEVGDAGTYPGDIWSFSTAEYAVIDDFENYNDVEPGRVFDTWLDGWQNTANGSVVGHEISPFAERTIVKSGVQSMPLAYDNTGTAQTSEATRTFGAAQDWTASGVKSLSLFFYGDPANTGQLYVKINNTKVLYNGSAADIQGKQWQPWNIDLSAVGGNLGNVTKLTIGIEGTGAGTLYIDDIRLYPRTLTLLTPTDPGKTGLLAEYTFDSSAADSSGRGHHGTFLDTAHAADGVLVLDGVDDAVAIPRLGGATATFKQCTYSMWMNSVSGLVSAGPVGGINQDNWSAGGIHCKFYNGKANAGINGLAGDDLNGKTVVEAGEWAHLALTVSDTVATIYLNGQAEASRAFGTPLTMILGSGAIGAWSTNGDIQRELKGQMDNIRIYDRALSPEELLWLAGKRSPVHKPF